MELKGLGIPAPVLEHRVHPKRLWRFDLAWPEIHFYVEIEGGSWGRIVECGQCKKAGVQDARVFRFSKASGKKSYVREAGHHTQGKGYSDDLEKYNSAILLGWRGMRFTCNQVRDGVAANFLNEFFHGQRPASQTDLFNGVCK